MNNKIPIFPRITKLGEQVGSQIKEARLRRGITTEEISNKTGISRSTIGAIEKGSLRVTLAKYLQVLSILDLERDILLLAKEDPIGKLITPSNVSDKKRIFRNKASLEKQMKRVFEESNKNEY